MALTRTNIIGRITLPDDTNPVNSVVRFVMTGFDTDDTENATIIQIPIDAAIDALGDIDVDLWPNPLGVRSTFYATYVRIPDGNTNDVINVYVGQISVPATGGPYDLNDLLPIAPPAGADVADYIAQLAASVALAESAAGGVFAAAAEASATSAELAAMEAETSATSAELAAIAAGASIYADTTAGLAATASGDVFLVPDANGMIVYENDTGVAVSLGRFRSAVFDSIAIMATATGLIDGQFITVNNGYNGTSEVFQYDAASTATADGALIVTATGMGAGRLISTRAEFATIASALADTRTLATGTVLTAESRTFETVSSGATFYHRVRADGVKLKDISATVFNFYVDNITGSDTNTGLTTNAPFATISKVRSVVREGDTINLLGGCVWREELDISTFRRVHVKRYGFGGRAVLDGADVIPNGDFSLAPTYTNTYQTSVVHGMSGTIKSFSVWEDAVRLIRATSVANCETTPGSFFAPAVSTSPQTIYVHPVDSTNPISDGKLYEVSKRVTGYNGSETGHVVGIHTRRSCWDHGSLINYGYALDCLAEDGTKHNFWNVGLAEKCTAWKGEDLLVAGSSTLFVTYRDSATDRTARYIECVALGDGYNNAGQVGFYAHTAGGGVGNNWASVIFDRCDASDVAQGYGCANVDIFGLLFCNAWRVNTGILAGAVKNVVCGGVLSGWQIDRLRTFRAVSDSGGTWFLRGVSCLARAASGGMIFGNFTTLDVENCDFAFLNKSSPRIAFDVNSATAVVNSQRNVFYDVDQVVYDLNAGATLTSDFNAFFPSTADFTVGGVNYTDFASYQAGTSQDAGSSTTDPAIVDGGRMDKPLYSLASPVWALNAGSRVMSPGQLISIFLKQTA